MSEETKVSSLPSELVRRRMNHSADVICARSISSLRAKSSRSFDLPRSALQRDADQRPLDVEQAATPSPRLTKAGGMPEIDDDFPAELARTTDPRKILTPTPADDE